MTSRVVRLWAIVFVALIGPVVQHACAHGVSIGRSAVGQLRVIYRVAMPVLLRPSPFPGINGWADAEPGFASVEVEDPGNDLYFLNPNCDIHFVLVGMDPGVQIVTDHAWVPGEDFEFGAPFFDDHLVFNIPDGMIGQEYGLQFRLYDASGIHADSPVYTLTFTPAAEACACRGDMNADAARTGADITRFVACLFETPEGSQPDSDCSCADMDGDGALDEADLSLFVAQLLASSACPP